MILAIIFCSYFLGCPCRLCTFDACSFW